MGNCVGGKGGGKKGDPKTLTDHEIKLLMDNTRLTRPQILALHRNFLKECPSGKLTKKDFVKLFKAVHPSQNKAEKADKFCEYVFKVIDKQNLGYISFEEFVLCFILTSDGEFKDKCDFAFRLYDLDKDNKISKKEMTQVLTALYDLSGITDRKGNAAPQKKVDDIIRKINLEHKLVGTPVIVAKKGAKPSKKLPAGPDFITKDQFIAACNSDEQIKHLFVDSIFCGGSDTGLTFTTPGATTSTGVAGTSFNANAGDLRFSGPSINANGGDIQINGPGLSRTHVDEPSEIRMKGPGLTHTRGVDEPHHIHNHENDVPSLIHVDLPHHDAKVELPKVRASVDKPVVDHQDLPVDHEDAMRTGVILNAVAPTASINVDTPEYHVDTPKMTRDIKMDWGGLNGAVKIDTPSVDVNVDAPSADVDVKVDSPKTSSSAYVNVDAPSADIKVDGPKADYDFNVDSLLADADKFNVKVDAPSVDVNLDAPSVDVKVDAPSANVTVDAPRADYDFKLDAPSVDVKTTNDDDNDKTDEEKEKEKKDKEEKEEKEKKEKEEKEAVPA